MNYALHNEKHDCRHQDGSPWPPAVPPERLYQHIAHYASDSHVQIELVVVYEFFIQHIYQRIRQYG